MTHAGADRRHVWAGRARAAGDTGLDDRLGSADGRPLARAPARRVAAIVLGVRVRDRTAAKVAIVLAALALTQMAVYTLISNAA